MSVLSPSGIRSTLVYAAAITLTSLLGGVQCLAHEIKSGAVVIHHPWARQSPTMAGEAAGFMTITNTGRADDRLVGVTSEISATAQIHDTKTQGDVTTMIELGQGLVIPAGGTVVLKPGSLHVMFTGLTQQVVEGEIFAGTLAFVKAGTVNIEYEVVGPDAKAH